MENNNETEPSTRLPGDLGELGQVLARIRAGLQETGGPALNKPVLLAYIDDEKLQEPSRRVLTETQRETVLGLITRYKPWFEAYWNMRATVNALPEELLERMAIRGLLGKKSPETSDPPTGTG